MSIPRYRFILTALALSLFTVALLEAVPSTPTNILFVGNSLTYFNQGINYHFQKMVESAGSHPTLAASAYTMSDATLEKLWNRNLSLQSSGNKSLFSLGKKFDLVVVQEHNYPFEAESFQKHVRLFAAAIREQGGEPILFLPWPCGNPGAASMDTITEAHISIAKELKIRIAPVGPTVVAAQKLRPDIELIISDNEHPSSLGTYLATCVIYATVYGESPVGNLYRSPFLEYMQGPNETITFLQEIAWKTAKEYQSEPETQ